MNNILFCTSLVTEGTLMDDYSAGALGFYDLETLELTDNVSGKDFGIVGASLLNKESIINIPDIHLLNVVSATIPLNVSYGITIEAAELEEESTDTSDVELIVLHKNVAPNGDWRQFITIPYAEFEGDTDNLLDIIVARLNDLADKGKLEGVQVNDVDDGVIQLYVNNIDQYEIITKSELLDISDPSGYKPVVVPTKLIDLIDKNTASWGIWHREEDDDWFKAVSQNVATNEYDTIISIQYTNLRKAGVTHDGPILRTLHIITTSSNKSAIIDAIGLGDGGNGSSDVVEPARGFMFYDTVFIRDKSLDVTYDGEKYYGWGVWTGDEYLTDNPLWTISLEDITDTYFNFDPSTGFGGQEHDITGITVADPTTLDPSYAEYKAALDEAYVGEWDDDYAIRIGVNYWYRDKTKDSINPLPLKFGWDWIQGSNWISADAYTTSSIPKVGDALYKVSDDTSYGNIDEIVKKSDMPDPK